MSGTNTASSQPSRTKRVQLWLVEFLWWPVDSFLWFVWDPFMWFFTGRVWDIPPWVIAAALSLLGTVIYFLPVVVVVCVGTFVVLAVGSGVLMWIATYTSSEWMRESLWKQISTSAFIVIVFIALVVLCVMLACSAVFECVTGRKPEQDGGHVYT